MQRYDKIHQYVRRQYEIVLVTKVILENTGLGDSKSHKNIEPFCDIVMRMIRSRLVSQFQLRFRQIATWTLAVFKISTLQTIELQLEATLALLSHQWYRVTSCLSGDIGSPGAGQLCDLQCGADYQDHLIRHSFPLCGCSKYRIWIKPQETAGENDRNICDHLIGIKSQDNAHWYTLTHIVARNWYRDFPFGMR